MRWICLVLAALPLRGFWEEFSRAMATQDDRKMTRLVLRDREAALYEFIDRCIRLADTGDETYADQLDALEKAWTTAFRGDLVLQKERAYLLVELDGPGRTRMLAIRNQWYALLPAVRGVAGDEDWRAIREAAVPIAKDMEEIGDLLEAAFVRYTIGRSHDPENLDGAGSLTAALAEYEAAMAHCEAMGRKDGWSVGVKEKTEWARREVERVKRNPPESGPAGPSALPPMPGAEAMTAALEPVALGRKATSAGGAGYDWDEVAMTWPGITLKESNANRQEILGFRPALMVHRKDNESFFLDLDGSGAWEKREPAFRGGGRLTALELPLEGPGGALITTVFLHVPGSQEPYQETTANLAPTETQGSVYFRTLASVQAKVGDTSVRLLDLNGDSRFDTAPVERFPWEYVGEPEWIPDGVLLGKARHPAPLSPVLRIGKSWCAVQVVEESGSRVLSATPLAIKTGRLKLVFEGPKTARPVALYVRGVGNSGGGIFDLAGSRNGIDVPVGRYELLGGVLRTGKAHGIRKAIILNGRHTGTIVTEGETAELAVGGPYFFNFKRELGREDVVVKGASVTVWGAEGEQYERFWHCAPKPEVFTRKPGRKKAGRGTRMRAVVDPTMLSKEGFAASWHPLDSTIRKGEGLVEVKLLEEEHPLLGEIESEWL